MSLCTCLGGSIPRASSRVLFSISPTLYSRCKGSISRQRIALRRDFCLEDWGREWDCFSKKMPSMKFITSLEVTLFSFRKFGTAIHEGDIRRSALKTVLASSVRRSFDKNKREFYNQILWTLDHLRKVAPDEEKLLRDLALGGSQAYVDLWGENDFRETFAYHLERYGLVRFDDDVPKVDLALIKQALQKPSVCEFLEQKRQLKGVIEAIEAAVRGRLCCDLEKDKSRQEAVQAAVNAIPSDAKNRPMGRQDLLDLGEAAGLAAVLEALNWGDYEILLSKFYDSIEWIGPAVEKDLGLR